jgi:hypothetical protein
VDFEQQFVGYLRGEWKRGGWTYYYVYGLAIKVPLGTWILVGIAAVLSATWWAGVRRDELVLLVFPIVLLAFVSSQTGINMFLRYALPVQPFLFVWGSKATKAFDVGPRIAAIVAAGALAWSVTSSLWHYPHSGSYFNELVGGPLGGPEHFLDANIGWGQDLLFLKRWYDRHPDARPLGLVYFGNLDARIAGLEFFLPPRGSKSANLRCGLPPEELGPYPGWFAVDVSFVYGENRQVLDGHGKWTPPSGYCDFSYFRRFQPVAYAGYSIYIYHLELPEVNQVREELGLGPLDAETVARQIDKFVRER